MFTDGFLMNKRKTLKKIALSLALILLIFYIVYHFIQSYYFTIKTTEALYTNLDIKETYTAYIFRDETVLYSNYGGSYDYLVDNGELVSPGTHLVDCYEKPTEIDVISKKEELIAEIERLTQSNGRKNFTVSDIDSAQTNARRTYMEMLKSATLGDMENADVYSEQMLIELNKLSVYYDYSNNFIDEIIAKKAELEALDAYYVGNVDESVKNEKTGHYFYAVDRYERNFSSVRGQDSRADTLTIPEFYSLIAGMPKDEVPNGYYCAGKMVNNYEWFIAVPLTNEQSDGYFLGKTYNVQYSGYKQKIPMVLSRIETSKSDNRAILIFKATDMPDGFTYPRSGEITLLRKEYSGLRVPIELVVKVDGYTGVYTVEKLTVKFRKINIIYREYGYYIVSEYDTSDERYSDYLRHNDSIITKGNNLYDGKVVG